MAGIGSEVLGGFPGFVVGHFCSEVRFLAVAPDNSSEDGKFVSYLCRHP